MLVVPLVLAVQVMASVEVANTPPSPAYTYIPLPYVKARIMLAVPLVRCAHVMASVDVANVPPAAPYTYNPLP